MSLSEQRRTQLDGIVQEMIKNKEPDSNIQFVVDDFKKKYENEQAPQIDTPKPQENILSGLAKGVGKGALSTIRNAGTLGENLLNKGLQTVLPKSLEPKFGFNGEQQPTSAEQLIPKSLVTPTTGAQKFGFAGEQIGEFFIPGSKISKAGKALEGIKALEGASKLATIGRGVAKLAPEALAASGQTSLQEGSTKNFIKNAILFGSLSKIGNVASKAIQAGTKNLPAKLVNTAIKPTLEESRKAITYGGETLGEEMLKRGLRGGDRQILDKSIKGLNESENKLQSILKNSKEVIRRDELAKYLDDIIKTKKETPGLVEEAKKVSSVLKQFPEQLSIQKANQVKRNIYNALRDVSYKLDPSLSTNKEAMKALASGIKQEIEKKTEKEVGKGVVESINKDLSVFGKVHDRVIDKLARNERNNLLGLGDLVAIGSGAGAGGFAGGFLTGALKKIAGSTSFKTNSAAVLNKIGNSLEKLPTDKAGKISKTALYKALAEITKN